MRALKRRVLIFLLIFLAMIGALFTTVIHSHMKRKGSLVIGAKDTTEGHLLSEIIAQLIEDKTSINIVRKFHLDGTFIAFNALKSKDVDLYVEYTGTALTAILKKDHSELPPKKVLPYLRKEFESRFDLIWMEPLGFECAYVLITHPKFAEERGVETLSDLKKLLDHDEGIKVAFDPEFYARPESDILKSRYEMKFLDFKLLDHMFLYLALNNRTIDVINGYATDGFILGHNLKVLEDNEEKFPSYEAVPIIRSETLKRYPELRAIFEEISLKITAPKMREMNYKVEKKGESVHNAAQYFLKREGLLSHF